RSSACGRRRSTSRDRRRRRTTASDPPTGASARARTRRARSAARPSSPQHRGIPVGDVRQPGYANRRAALLELVSEPRQDVGKLLYLVEPDAVVSHELGMTPAAQERGGKTARESLEQRVRARIVAAGRKEEVR